MGKAFRELWIQTPVTAQNFVHISGLPCAGKTRLRRRIQCLAQFVTVDIEPLWHELFVSPDYSLEQSDFVFGEFTRRIEGHLKSGASVIAESILASESRLRLLDQMAAKHGVRHLFVMADAARATLVSRLQSKARRFRNAVPLSAFEELERRFQTRCHADLILDTTNGVARNELEPIRHWIYGTSIYP